MDQPRQASWQVLVLSFNFQVLTSLASPLCHLQNGDPGEESLITLPAWTRSSSFTGHAWHREGPFYRCTNQGLFSFVVSHLKKSWHRCRVTSLCSPLPFFCFLLCPVGPIKPVTDFTWS
jgi:hypothetical protein